MAARKANVEKQQQQRPVDLKVLTSPTQIDVSVPTPIFSDTSTPSTRPSLGTFLQMAQQGGSVLQQRRSQQQSRRSRRQSVSSTGTSQIIMPGVSFSYGHAIKAGFQKFFCRHIDDFFERGKINVESPIEEINDIDFVFIVRKNNSRSLSFRCANWFARTLGRDQVTEDDLQTARIRYLEGLKNKYKISYTKISSFDYDFYPIKLSFYHLGLMMQLLSYTWRLRTAVEDKYAYKTFYFMKRDVERYHEYQNCRTREDFSARWRYDLTYNFLVAAHAPALNINPWRSLLKQTLSQPNLQIPSVIEEEIEHDRRHEKTYTLLHLFTDELFDDWLVPHNPIREPNDDRVVHIIDSIQESGSNGQKCCTNCCFPCWTCQCREAKENRLSNKFKGEKTKKFCGACALEFCNGWRSFCFHNSVDCMDRDQRPNENEREFLGRISTVRNAFTQHSFPSPPQEGPAKIRHILPLNTLVKYLGEKIGFYFGWIELLIFSMTIPSILGILMFLIGLAYYAWDVNWGAGKTDLHIDATSWVLAKACDNYATPGFAAIMVIWGTTFYEMWHRRQKWYSYLWHVEKLETTELERPAVYSFKTTAKLQHSPYFKPILYIPSVAVTVFFIGLVFFSVYFVNVVGVFAIPYCPKAHSNVQHNDNDSTTTTTTSPRGYPFISTMHPQPFSVSNSSTNAAYVDANVQEDHVNKLICSLFSAAQVIANSLSMLVLDFIYTRLCYILTDMEGHKTQSAYTNALVLKLFTFRFFNYYSVLFYIAFAIPAKVVQYPIEITGGKEYDYDSYGCGEQPCMAMLSRQLLSVIVTQPLINSLLDVTMPCIKYIALAIKRRARPERPRTPPSRSDGKTSVDDSGTPMSARPSTPTSRFSLAYELDKQANLTQLSTLDRREFTTEEYTEKVIVYGALLMFSVALPPAPALAILIMRIDLNLDIGRIMNDFRRPIPLRAQDIGMWGPIVNFLTYLGILTNPLIIILTSSWGTGMPLLYKFLIFLGFEHIVFAIRMLVSFAVPDVPKSLVREQLIHKATKDELQTLLLDAKIEQAEATRHQKQPVAGSVSALKITSIAANISRLQPVAEQYSNYDG